MNSKITNKSNIEVELEITVEAEEFNEFFAKALLSMGKDLEIKGFRKGNAPKESIEEHFGLEKILVTAADLAVNDAYKKAIIENKIEAIFYPSVQVKKMAKGNDFIFTTKTAVIPEIKLPDYSKIVSKEEKKKVAVTDEEVNKSLTWLAKSRSKLTVKNDKAQKGDFIEIEYSIAGNNGEPIKDGFILGEGRMLPGFEDNLVGMKANEEKKNVELDSNGKKFIVDVKIISVQNAELPKINDDFAKSLGEFKDLESLKKNIAAGILKEKEQAEIQRQRFELLEKISEKTNIELPEVLIENEQKQIITGVKDQVAQNLKIKFTDYLERVKKTEDELFASFKSEAIKKIKNFLILKEIAKKENIIVTEEEVTAEVNKTLAKYPTKEEAAKITGGNITKLKEYTREVIKNDKVFQILDNLIK